MNLINPSIEVLKAVARLEQGRDWKVFYAWLETFAEDSLRTLVLSPDEDLVSARAIYAVASALVETFANASDIVKDVEASTTGTPPSDSR